MSSLPPVVEVVPHHVRHLPPHPQRLGGGGGGGRGGGRGAGGRGEVLHPVLALDELHHDAPDVVVIEDETAVGDIHRVQLPLYQGLRILKTINTKT